MLLVLCTVLPFLFWTALLSAESPRPTSGGVLHVALRTDPKTFNPIIAMDAPSRDVIWRLHSDLISINRVTQKTVPALCESWKLEGFRYILKLRHGVRFSDGAPFTASDVVFSFAVYLDEKVNSPQRDLLIFDSKSIEVKELDPFTVAVTLPAPYAAAERLFDSIAMLPKHKLETAWKAGKLRESWRVNTNPAEIVGLGPYRLREYRPGEAVLLERNPFYWKVNLPYLDGIEFRVLADEDLQLARFQSGELDILNRLSPKAVSMLQSQPEVNLADLGPGLEYNFLCFNLAPDNPKIGWFGRREFREALSLAVDRHSITKLVFQNRATPIWGHVSPGNHLWHSAAIPQPARSLIAAKAKLSAAGFHWTGLGVLVDAAQLPVQFSILVSSSSSERQKMAAILQDDFKQLGISVTVVTLEFRTLLDRVLKTRKFDATLLGLGGGDADPNPEMGVWLSSGSMHLWNPEQKMPGTKWESEIDILMKRQMLTVNYRERRRLYDQVQEIVAREQPMIFLVSPNVVVSSKKRLGNFKPAILDHQTLWNADELFIPKDARRP